MCVELLCIAEIEMCKHATADQMCSNNQWQQALNNMTVHIYMCMHVCQVCVHVCLMCVCVCVCVCVCTHMIDVR